MVILSTSIPSKIFLLPLVVRGMVAQVHRPTVYSTNSTQGLGTLLDSYTVEVLRRTLAEQAMGVTRVVKDSDRSVSTRNA